MAGQIANVKIGICDISYKGTDLGYTKGTVKVSYKPTYEDITVNQFGKSKIDKVLSGETLEIKVPLAESDLAKILVAVPSSAKVSNYYKFGSEAGFSLRNTAGELILHPRAVTGTGEDVVVYKAVVSGDIELDYQVDGQRVIEVTFEGLIDTTKANGQLLGHFGTIS